MPETTKIIIAAGGLLGSHEDDVLRIAVIYRGRYDDWTLPKGHIEDGEAVEDAAIREVEEETGCLGEIIEIVRPVSYLAKGQPKIVVFYRMSLVKCEEFTPNDEISGVKWLTLDEALSQLSFDVDRALVTDVYSV